MNEIDEWLCISKHILNTGDRGRVGENVCFDA